MGKISSITFFCREWINDWLISCPKCIFNYENSPSANQSNWIVFSVFCFVRTNLFVSYKSIELPLGMSCIVAPYLICYGWLWKPKIVSLPNNLLVCVPVIYSIWFTVAFFVQFFSASLFLFLSFVRISVNCVLKISSDIVVSKRRKHHTNRNESTKLLANWTTFVVMVWGRGWAHWNEQT